ncbi:MAG: hypothetical protein HQL15_07485 [Candidatus Omnitrophica bacterium]|nr:hypothetical protein [Candidatus Omnitrophota bacterium]
MDKITGPIFCLTSDTDWASDFAIEDLISTARSFNIKPMLFATNQSQVLEKHLNSDTIEVGLHPNYLLGSTHGQDIISVTDHIMRLFPRATAYRSHCFYYQYAVEAEMTKRDIRYDSNMCLYLQPGIVPLRRVLGVVAFPVFWEDDTHWYNQATWNVDSYLPYFLTPGLKILNVHPFFFTSNIPNQEYYGKIKGFIQTASAQNIQDLRYKGQGVRTFVLDLLKVLTDQGHRFYSFSELCSKFPLEKILHPPINNVSK